MTKSALEERIQAACLNKGLSVGEALALLDEAADALLRLSSERDEMVEALKPFKEALDDLDGDTPPDLRCGDDYYLEDALWKESQPTVGDLRRLVRSLLSKPQEGGER